MEWIMWRTGSMTNWIQEDDFNWLHNMLRAKFNLLHSMWGAKCTICEEQSLSICRKSIFLQGKINVPARCLLCMQTFGCMPMYGRIFHNSRIFLQNINISDLIRFKTAQYCRFISKFCKGMSVHGDAEHEVVLHPFQPALPLVCAAASVLAFNQSQCASQYILYSRPPCIVLYLCFWFQLGFPSQFIQINQGVKGHNTKASPGVPHTRASFEPGTSRFSTRRINHYATRG